MDYSAGNAASISDAFQRIYDLFVTTAHENTYTTKWNTLTFADLEVKHTGKTNAAYFDLLFRCVCSLLFELDPGHHSLLLFRDCIIKAVKTEPFYTLLLTTYIPQDPNMLHIRLYQCVRQLEANSQLLRNTHQTPQKQLYLTDESDNPDTHKWLWILLTTRLV